MTYDEAISKAVKLLRLTQSSNPHEAALAASRAQEIIDRYRIESKALDLASNGHAAPDEPIKDFGLDPLDPGTRQIITWKWRLFLVLGKLHGVKGYRSRLGGLAIVGRPSQVSTVRYFYAWLCREVDRLADADCRGNGRTYANSFRNGIIDTVGAKLNSQRREVGETVLREIEAGELPAEAKELALARVKSSLACFEREEEEVGGWMKSNLHLRGGGSGSRTMRVDHSARQAGQLAGHKIRLQPAAAHIGSAT